MSSFQKEVKKCSKSLKNNKTGGNGGLVGELLSKEWQIVESLL
jgi:hypothetical protein